MKKIAYSLFGYNRERVKNCLDFNSYLRGLIVNIRVNRIIYPDWKTIVYMDENTYESEYRSLFQWFVDAKLLEVSIEKNNTPLCMAMLWRLKPIWDMNDGGYRNSHVLCRDIDAVCTYREAQAVQEWINEDRSIHCITDSISHSIPMMGGMIGIMPARFITRMKYKDWDHMMESVQTMDFSRKGSDQIFLCNEVYPKFLDSATEHFVKGMKWTVPEGNGRHYEIADIKIGVPEKFKVLNEVVGHIGAAGYYETQMIRFLLNDDPYTRHYKEIESQFSHIFYWRPS